MIEKLRDALRVLYEIRRTQESLHHATRESYVQELLRSQAKYQDPRNLNVHEHQFYSQAGQDGIITEIFRRIGTSNLRAVEIGVGVGGGLENNTVALLARGWSAAWFEGSAELSTTIRANLGHLIEAGRLNLLNSFITAENAGQLLLSAGTPIEFDLLSIDIDWNDLFVWKALATFRPRVVVIEYNSYFPADLEWTMPYVADARWVAGGIEFGASLLALERTGSEMGYSLVACDLTGSDAFFVRTDLVGDLFQPPFTSTLHYEPMRYHLIHRPGYRRTLTPHFGVALP